MVYKTSSVIGDKLDLEFLQNQPNDLNAWAMPNMTAGFRGGFDLVPRNFGPTFYNCDTGTCGHSLSRTDLYNRNRDNLLFASSYLNDDFFGSHSFKFGFEWESSLSARYYSHELRHYIRNGDWYHWYNYGTYAGGTIIKRYAGNIQDSWSVNERWTLNLGVRFDSTGLSAQDPNAEALAAMKLSCASTIRLFVWVSPMTCSATAKRCCAASPAVTTRVLSAVIPSRW